MSLNDKIANELNHFLKIITYKDEAEADESLTKSDKEKSISLMRVNASGEGLHKHFIEVKHSF